MSWRQHFSWMLQKAMGCPPPVPNHRGQPDPNVRISEESFSPTRSAQPMRGPSGPQVSYRFSDWVETNHSEGCPFENQRARCASNRQIKIKHNSHIETRFKPRIEKKLSSKESTRLFKRAGLLISSRSDHVMYNDNPWGQESPNRTSGTVDMQCTVSGCEDLLLTRAACALRSSKSKFQPLTPRLYSLLERSSCSTIGILACARRAASFA